MSDKKESTSRSFISLGFGSVLFFILLTLKLTGHIDWSWWWVTAPLWGPVALIVLLVLLVGFAGAVVVLIAAFTERRK